MEATIRGASNIWRLLLEGLVIYGGYYQREASIRGGYYQREATIRGGYYQKGLQATNIWRLQLEELLLDGGYNQRGYYQREAIITLYGCYKEGGYYYRQDRETNIIGRLLLQQHQRAHFFHRLCRYSNQHALQKRQELVGGIKSILQCHCECLYIADLRESSATVSAYTQLT